MTDLGLTSLTRKRTGTSKPSNRHFPALEPALPSLGQSLQIVLYLNIPPFGRAWEGLGPRTGTSQPGPEPSDSFVTKHPSLWEGLGGPGFSNRHFPVLEGMNLGSDCFVGQMQNGMLVWLRMACRKAFWKIKWVISCGFEKIFVTLQPISGFINQELNGRKHERGKTTRIVHRP